MMMMMMMLLLRTDGHDVDSWLHLAVGPEDEELVPLVLDGLEKIDLARWTLDAAAVQSSGVHLGGVQVQKLGVDQEVVSSHRRVDVDINATWRKKERRKEGRKEKKRKERKVVSNNNELLKNDFDVFFFHLPMKSPDCRSGCK